MKTSVWIKVFLALLLLGSVSPQVADSQVPDRYREAVDKSREIIGKTMAAQKIPGLSIAVAVDGKIVWSEGFGFADLENNLKVAPATRFRIASVSKVITAAAMARIYEQGKLDLDAPVQKYVPEFPSKGVVITARQLVGHLSGIRHLRRDPDPEKDEFYNRKTYCRNVSEGLNRFQADPLDFVPGRYVDEARELAGSIKRRYFPPAGSAYQALRDAGTAAYNAGNYGEAASLFGQTLALADDNPGLWMDFAIASLGREPDDWT